MTDTARQAVIDKVAEAAHPFEQVIGIDGNPSLRTRSPEEIAAAVLDALSREDLLALLGAEQVGWTPIYIEAIHFRDQGEA